MEESPQRCLASFWPLFTTDAEPHKSISARCRHCRNMVRYYYKSEQAKTHLRKCERFRVSMLQLPVEERPEWYKPKVTRRFALESSGSDSPCKQQRLSLSVVPKMSREEQQQFDHMLAMHWIMAGNSFYRIEEPHLKAALKVLRPDVEVPSRRRIASAILDEVYEELKEKVISTLQHAQVCLSTDAWTNVLGQSIVNYIASVHGQAFYIESVATGAQNHTGAWLCSDISRVIEENEMEIVGVVTDNASANKVACRMLEQKYPGKFFYGCISHALNLLAKNILDPAPTARTPFEELAKFLRDARDIITTFTKNQVLRATLVAEQKSQGLRALVKQAPTRWCSMKDCAQALMDSEKTLLSMVSQRSFTIVNSWKTKAMREKVRQCITSADFVPNLSKVVEILAPIDYLIVKYQSDSIPISDIIADFDELKGIFQKLATNKNISGAELRTINTCISAREEFIVAKPHMMAYLLDPKYFGRGCGSDVTRRTEDWICASPNDDTKAALYVELNQFVEFCQYEKATDSFRYGHIKKRTKSPLQFWALEGIQWPHLQFLARRLFSLTASSASSERNFSAMGVHSF